MFCGPKNTHTSARREHFFLRTYLSASMPLMCSVQLWARCSCRTRLTSDSAMTTGAGAHRGSPGYSVLGAPRTCMSVIFTCSNTSYDSDKFACVVEQFCRKQWPNKSIVVREVTCLEIINLPALFFPFYWEKFDSTSANFFLLPTSERV